MSCQTMYIRCLVRLVDSILNRINKK